jgi:phosphopentomutase
MITPLTRAILVVLDGVGVGGAPDAAAYGDAGASSLEHCAAAVGGLALPEMGRLGLGNVTPICGTPPTTAAEGAFGRMAERSAGKDSTTGHWEMTGVILNRPLPTYPQGFPADLVARFERAIGRKVLGNTVASGTAIIQELGEAHLRTGRPVLYTSADSVFQVAAHEAVIPLEELYRMCQVARSLLAGEHAVGRVIARPFTGEPGNFRRTPHRRDFSLAPPICTLLDKLREQRYDVIAVGKIDDLFAGRGITQREHTGTNEAGMAAALQWLARDFRGLLFVNLVECDQLWGHRRDPQGYARALLAIDGWVGEVRRKMRADDVLFITGDHGVDPTAPGTDHTRECVPLLVCGRCLRANRDLGTRPTFADLGATLAEAFAVGPPDAGNSFAALL